MFAEGDMFAGPAGGAEGGGVGEAGREVSATRREASRCRTAQEGLPSGAHQASYVWWTAADADSGSSSPCSIRRSWNTTTTGNLTGWTRQVADQAARVGVKEITQRGRRSSIRCDTSRAGRPLDKERMIPHGPASSSRPLGRDNTPHPSFHRAAPHQHTRDTHSLAPYDEARRAWRATKDGDGIASCWSRTEGRSPR